MWFRGVVHRLSPAWRTRLFDALRASVEIPNHIVRLGRQQARLSELGHAQLREALTSPSLPDAIRPDVELLVTIGRVWGEDALRQFHFREMACTQRRPDSRACCKASGQSSRGWNRLARRHRH